MQLNESPVSSLGPGSYSPIKNLYSCHSAVFSKDDRFKHVKSSSPGPGAYDPKGEKVVVTKFSTAQRGVKNSENFPGPGYYETPQSKSPGKSMIGRNFINDSARISPGPGSYDFPIHLLESSPSYSMNKASRVPLSTTARSPGFLSLGSTLISPGKSFPKGKRPELVNDNHSPDPTKYNKPSFIGEGPKFSIPERKTNYITSDVPGPAYYSPKLQLTKNASTFSRQARFTLKTSNSPGPGQYESLKFKPITYSFPKKVIEAEDSDDEPGPGHYNLPSSFPESVKSKSLKKKLPETHFY
jgi:hypothetical protein